MRHLIDTTDISVAEVDKIINTALDIIDNRDKYREVCKVRSSLPYSMSQVPVLV